MVRFLVFLVQVTVDAHLAIRDLVLALKGSSRPLETNNLVSFRSLHRGSGSAAVAVPRTR